MSCGGRVREKDVKREVKRETEREREGGVSTESRYRCRARAAQRMREGTHGVDLFREEVLDKFVVVALALLPELAALGGVQVVHPH